MQLAKIDHSANLANPELEHWIISEITKLALQTTNKDRQNSDIFEQWVDLRLMQMLPNKEVNETLKITVKEHQNLRDVFRWHGCRWLERLSFQKLEEINDSPIVGWLKRNSKMATIAPRKHKRSKANFFKKPEITYRQNSPAVNHPFPHNPVAIPAVVGLNPVAETCIGCEHLGYHWRGYACKQGGLWIGSTLTECKIPRWCPRKYKEAG